MKLSAWAQKNQISYQTAWKWVKNGKLPPGVEAHKTSTGIILIEEKDRGKLQDVVCIFAKVAPREGGDVEKQVEKLKAFAISKGYQIYRIEKEIGPKGRRKKLFSILKDYNYEKLLISSGIPLSITAIAFTRLLLEETNRFLEIVD